MRNGYHDDAVTTYVLKAAEITINQGCAAILDLANTEQCENAGEAGAAGMIGVLLDTEHEAGKAGSYQYAGVALCKASAAVAAGVAVMIADTTGRFVAHDGSSKERVGISQSAASAANEFFRVLLALPSPDIS